MLNNAYFALGLGGPEIWVIVILVLVLFGAKKIPELMRGVGQGVGELQKGIQESKRTLEQAAEEARTEESHKP